MAVYVIGSSLTLDDLCQLQSLLSHEHRKREKYAVDHHRLHKHPVNHHHELQFRHAMTPAVAKREQKRLQVALEHLKVLKEQYRRQRALQIQAYLDSFRRQQLIRAVLEEEEEKYYRQCISAALEKKRVNAIFNHYLLLHQFQQQKLEEEKIGERFLQNEGANEPEAATLKAKEDDDEGYSEYHSQQLAELLKQLFNQQPVFDNDDNDTEGDIADVWQYVMDIPGEEKPSYQFDAPMTERQIPSLVRHPVAQDPVTAYINQRERAYDDANQDSEKLQPCTKIDGKREGIIQADKEKIEKDNEDKVYSKELESGQQQQQQHTNLEENESLEINESSEQSDTESLPPLQDHVLTLQDLIKELSSEPVMVGEQYIAPEPVKKDVSYLGTQSSDKRIPEYVINQSDSETRHENESPATFMPQSIITSAEPTPTIEQSATDVDKDISNFVDSIAAEQKQDISSESDNDNICDPRKSAKPEIPVQSERGEVNSFETDNNEFQNKSNTLDHVHASQATLANQQPLPQQSVNAPIKDSIFVSAKPGHLNSYENMPAEENDQRVPANFNLSTPSVHGTNKDKSVENDDILERDPAKQLIYTQLDQIESKINNPELKSRLDKVLQSKLTFSKEGGGTLLLSASTQADREFLGLEDELLRIMLELDNIISEGDEGIRDYRRALVKRCEAMLDRLDQHKQKEWEKTIGTKHHRHHSHKK